jgi:hypothetical protein
MESLERYLKPENTGFIQALNTALVSTKESTN